jgi:hypothetical protein
MVVSAATLSPNFSATSGFVAGPQKVAMDRKIHLQEFLKHVK